MAADLLELPSTAAAPPAPAEPIPAKIGKYAIHGLIGRGGMGVVYRAHDPDLDRDVALKTLIPRGSADSDWVCRFRQEAHAAAKLRHPGIVPIHETGESEGLVFFTMDLIEGKSFAAALRDGGLSTQGGSRSGPPPASPEERARRLPSTLGVIASVAEALGYAHEQGIVHRDVKPQNILLDKEGRPYVTDFGLAKDVSKLSVLTETSALMGTLWYMSPEQARGSARDATAESDVFALGAILYEVLTGGLPFTGETDFDVREAIIRRSPRRPSEVEPSTPADVEAICLKALEKDPASRYPTARELALELRRCLKASEAADYIPTLEPMEESEVEELLHADARRVRRARRVGYMGAGLVVLVALAFTVRLWPRPKPGAVEDPHTAAKKAEDVLCEAERCLGEQPIPLDGAAFEKEHPELLQRLEDARGFARKNPLESLRLREGCDAIFNAIEAARLREKAKGSPAKEVLPLLVHAHDRFMEAKEWFEKRAEEKPDAQAKLKQIEMALADDRKADSLSVIARIREEARQVPPVPPGCEEDRWQNELDETEGLKRYFEMDKNSDGSISKDEWSEDQAIFEAADTDHDGSISEAECVACWHRFVRDREHRGLDAARMAQSDNNKKWTWDTDTFTSMDKDGDGLITKYEWSPEYGELENVDADHDGSVSLDEWRSAAKKGDVVVRDPRKEQEHK